MLTRTSRSLTDLPTHRRVIPVVETRVQFVQVLEKFAPAILLRHCNIFDFAELLERADRYGSLVYVNVDHIDGVHADTSGLRYLAERLHVHGVISNHPKTLQLAHEIGLETIQRLFAVDSTGLEMALEGVDRESVDLLDISPALVVPYILPSLPTLPVPFMASGLVYTSRQVQAILRTGAVALAVTRPELWL